MFGQWQIMMRSCGLICFSQENLVVRISTIKSICTCKSTNKNYNYVMTIICYNGKEDVQHFVELNCKEDIELIYCILMGQLEAKDISENIEWEE